MDAKFMSTPEQLNEAVAERKAWMASSRKHREDTIRKLASQEAKRDKSNPFAYSTVASMLRNNIATPDDFRKRGK